MSAVRNLEVGRNVLWVQWLETRGDLERVRTAAPLLAHDLMRVREILDDAPPSGRNH